MRQTNNIQQKNRHAQATLEFAFCFIVAILVFYSCVKALQWVGVAFVRSRIDHESIKQNPPRDNNWVPGVLGAQLDRPSGELPAMELVFNGQLMKAP